MNIYLAGPLGFSEAGRDYLYRVLIPEIQRLGHNVIDPWKLTDASRIGDVNAMPFGEDRRKAWIELNSEIGMNNQKAIDACDSLLAVLDGTDVDSGTAAEIGYAFARAKRIVGYRGDFRLSADNEGAIVNIQVEYFIRQSGGSIISGISGLPEVLATVRAQAPTSSTKDKSNSEVSE